MRNPVYNAINKKLLVFGLDRTIFMIIFVTGALIFWMSSILWALGAFAILFLAALRVTKKDPELFAIWLTQSSRANVYDCCLR
jgi:type IV secretory pathway VirB3-like protein